MANYTTLKTAIQTAIKTNGNNEITGKILQQQLLATINSLGSDYQLAGTLRPTDTPKTDDQRIVYLAVKPGMYEHAGGFEVTELSLLTYGAEWHMYPLGVPFGSQIAEDITAAVDAEKTRATTAEATLTKKINTEAFERKNADAALDTRVTAIEDKIPAQASSENKLADKEFVNNSIATATATFRGTFDTLEALKATQADKNDYAFWVHKDEDGNTCYDKYTYTDTEWKFEYRLNNSSFTTAQWAALNSGVTADVIKALQDADKANAKAIADEKAAREQADTTLQGNINAENTRATTAEATLTKKINTEAFERKSADATLQDNIDKKQDIISDLTTIRTQAATAYGWGDHSEAGYITGVTKAMVEGVLTGNITSHTHSYLPLSGGMMTNTDKVTNLNADLLDGLDSGNFMRNQHTTSTSATSIDANDVWINSVKHDYRWQNVPVNTIASLLDLTFDSDWRTQLFFQPASTLKIFARARYNGTTWGAWREMAFADSNVASASKWATARTITLTGSVTGSVSIDGSANVSLDTTTNHTHTFASLTSKPTTISGYGITDAYTKTETDNKVEALQSLLDSMFERVYDSNNKLIRIHSNVTISSSGDLVAGSNSEGGGTSGGAYTQLEWNAIKALTQSESGLLASAYSVKEAYNELNTAIETLAGKATNVKFTQTLTSGKQIGSISIDGKSTSLYAPASYAWSEITGKPSFATVATSGSYTDLTNKPTIASLMGSTAIGGTSSYIYWNGSAWATKALGSNAFTSISKVSQLTNDSGYITGITKAMVEGVLTGNITSHTHSYLPLAGGTVTGQLYLTGLAEGTSDVTDNTEILTSYASNNGFADSKGLVHRRDAIHLYNYVKSKLDSDSIYLPLSGGKMTGTILIDNYTAFGQTGGNFYLGTPNYPLLLRSSGMTTINGNTLLHSGNIESYALPLSGGTLMGGIEMGNNPITSANKEVLISYSGVDTYLKGSSHIYLDTPNLYQLTDDITYTILHSGNYNSYALPLTGGTLTGSVTMSGMDTNLIRNITAAGTTGWARALITLQVDGVNKFGVSALGDYTAGASDNGIVYGYIGCNSYDGLNLRISATSLSWGNDPILHSGNYNSYAPKLDGTGASGTWGINISGNAATATDADTLDGYHASRFLTTNYSDTVDLNKISVPSILRLSTENPNLPSSIFNYGNLLTVKHPATDTAWQLIGSYSSDALWFRRGTWYADGTGTLSTNAWKQIAFIDSNISGNAATATNADKLDGYHAQAGQNKPWGTIPAITPQGWMDVGRQFEFHYDNTTDSDYSTILRCTGNYSNVINLPSASGTLALLTDNVASATKLQNSRTIWGQSFDGTGNVSGALTGVSSITASGHAKVYSLKTDHICIECDNSGNPSGRSSEINNYDGHLYLQHDTSHNCFICTGGGKVGIGTNNPSYKLHIVGAGYASGNLIAAGDLTAGSDIRYKDKIQDLRLSVHDIALAPAFTYKWNNRSDALVHIGSSAQYWLNTDAKDAVYYDKQNDFYHLNYASLALCNTIILARGMETQEEKIARLEERIKELEDKIRQNDSCR